MTTSEETHARHLAGTANQEALQVIAAHLHANESIHMHDLSGDRGRPCNYCWLRAGRALHGLRAAGLPIVLGPDPVPAGEPVEVDVAVLHDLESLAARGKQGDAQGWTVVSAGAGRVPWAERLLVFRSQDHRHYGVRFAEFLHADPAGRVVCHPVTPHYTVTQAARYELAVPR